MHIFKTTAIVLRALLCFSCLIQAKSEVESTVDDREIGQESLFENNEGSGEIDVFGEEANIFATEQLDTNPLINMEDKIEENFMNAKIHEKKADGKEGAENKGEDEAENSVTTEIVEDEANEDEEDIKEMTADIFEDETKKDGDSIEKILIAEIEENKEPSPYSTISKDEAVEGHIDEDPGKEDERGSDVQQHVVRDDGKKYSREKKKFGQGYLRHAVDLIGELRKDLKDMIPIKKFPLFSFK